MNGGLLLTNGLSYYDWRVETKRKSGAWDSGLSGDPMVEESQYSWRPVSQETVKEQGLRSCQISLKTLTLIPGTIENI